MLWKGSQVPRSLGNIRKRTKKSPWRKRQSRSWRFSFHKYFTTFFLFISFFQLLYFIIFFFYTFFTHENYPHAHSRPTTHTHDPRPLPTTHEILLHSHVLRFEQQACWTGNLPESHATVGKSTAVAIASKGKGMGNIWIKVYVSQSRQIPFYNIIVVLILSSFMYLYLFLSLSLNSPVEGEGGGEGTPR